jgi:hypothetical protein
VLLEQEVVADQGPHHQVVKEVLDEYHDVFSEPTELPPSRPYDHHIPLIPGVVPMNSKPYRYSPLHKDEIEKEVNALLKSGLIIPSVSPFAFPVLLVRKKGWFLEILCTL